MKYGLDIEGWIQSIKEEIEQNLVTCAYTKRQQCSWDKVGIKKQLEWERRSQIK